MIIPLVAGREEVGLNAFSGSSLPLHLFTTVIRVRTCHSGSSREIKQRSSNSRSNRERASRVRGRRSGLELHTACCGGGQRSRPCVADRDAACCVVDLAAGLITHRLVRETKRLQARTVIQRGGRRGKPPSPSLSSPSQHVLESSLEHAHRQARRRRSSSLLLLAGGGEQGRHSLDRQASQHRHHHRLGLTHLASKQQTHRQASQATQTTTSSGSSTSSRTSRMRRKLGKYYYVSDSSAQQESEGVTVKLGRDSRTNRSVIVKVFENSAFKTSAGARELVKFEIETMSRTSGHPHVVQLSDVLVSPSHLFVIMDKVHGGDLFDVVAAEGR